MRSYADIELGDDGDPGLLDRVERRLLEAGVRRSDARSKLARLLGDRLPSPERAVWLGRRSTVGEVVLAYLREQGEAIRWGDPAVRQNAADAVHKMRVATRRMRSALQAYGKVVDRAATRELTDELKWLAGVLGDARDLEVLHARFTHAVDGLPDELVVGPVAARLTRFLRGAGVRRPHGAGRRAGLRPLPGVARGDRRVAGRPATDAPRRWSCAPRAARSGRPGAPTGRGARAGG